MTTVDADRHETDAGADVAEFCELVVARLLDGERSIAEQIEDIEWAAATLQLEDEDAPSLEKEIGHAVLTSFRHAVAFSGLGPEDPAPHSNGKEQAPRRAPERVEVVGAVVDPSIFPRSPWTAPPRPVKPAPEVRGPLRSTSAPARITTIRTPLRHRVLATALPWLQKFRPARVQVEEMDAAALKRRRKLATGFAWVQNVGALLILFAGWQIWGTTLTEHHAQASLKQQFETSAQQHAKTIPATSSPATSTTKNAPITLVPASTPLPNPPQGAVVGKIQIPAIGVDEYVVSGTTEADLSMGPGHYVGTALPGQAGNVDIAGHRTTYGAPFYRLGQMVPGEPIELTTLSGETLTYVVTGDPTVVSPSDTAILGYFGDNRLTLTTCTPPFSASHRLVVVAALKMPGAAGVRPRS